MARMLSVSFTGRGLSIGIAFMSPCFKSLVIIL
jgi:hypothetical protein